MAPPSQLIQYPHLLPILLLLAAAVASDHLTLRHQAAASSDEPQDQALQQGMMGRPGCRDKCGGMSIPFPFGMDKPDCFLSGFFEVTCNTSFTPPRAFLAYSGGSAQGPPYKVIYQNTFGTETAADSPEDMFGYEVLSRKLARGFPLVLDFAIRYARCQQDSCPSGNSSCAEAANDRNGHVCKC